ARHRRTHIAVARCIDGHGSLATFCWSRKNGFENFRPPDRVAKLDLPAPERRRRKRRVDELRQTNQSRIRLQENLILILFAFLWLVMNLYDRIPNNVNLSEDKKLQRALEKWLPNYLDWWREMGPDGFQEKDVWLRTAVDVGSEGWAHFDYVKMPDYRWGIFLEPPQPDAKVGFGDNYGRTAYQEVPGEFRNALRRIIVTQGDTEPASVEQQRQLGKTCPSLYDLRNLFQVNVEEGRHLWAMVYLLHGYFGRDGRDEADELLERRSGNPDKPRILEAFNQPCDDWLNFFAFTMFTDRDGKYQLSALAESGFEPLARTCQFMLTEEAHHM